MFALAATAIGSNVPADDWPRWMGPKMDGIWRETGIVEWFPEAGPPIGWRHELGSGYAGPAVAGGRVFVMDRIKDSGKGREVENELRKHGEIPGSERVMCFDAATGAEIWSHVYERPYKIAYPTGPRCTPFVDGEFLYTLGAMGDLLCLKTLDGSVIWQKQLMEVYHTKPPIWGYAAHPLIVGDRLYATVGGDNTAVVCLDKSTGAEIWHAATVSDIGYAPLVMFEDQGRRQLILWSGDGVESINPEDGRSLWQVVYPETKAQAAATSIITPPIVGNRLLVSEYYSGSMLLEIQSDPPGVREIWRSAKDDPKHEKSLNALMTTPFVENGFVYGVTGEGEMRCVDWESHQPKWTDHRPLGEKAAEFATCFIVKNGERFFLFNDQGELIIARLSPDGYQEVSRAKILEPTGAARGRAVVWTCPAFAQGCMFIRNEQEVVCVDLLKKQAGSGQHTRPKRQPGALSKGTASSAPTRLRYD
jgi:outer membrane protein assembly factor BamB